MKTPSAGALHQYLHKECMTVRGQRSVPLPNETMEVHWYRSGEIKVMATHYKKGPLLKIAAAF